MSVAAGELLDVMVGVCLGSDVSSVYDDNAWPNPSAGISGHPLYWRTLYNWLWFQQLPLGYPPIYCGVAVPNYSGDVEAARAAADSLGVEYDSQDDAVAICNAIVDECWTED